jgi:hypothetical protein
VTIEQDFETVRYFIELGGHRGPVYEAGSGQSALSRIEADWRERGQWIRNETAGHDEEARELIHQRDALKAVLKEIDRVCNTQHGMAASARTIARQAIESIE